jgi:PD-(D/E)XK endonuclease
LATVESVVLTTDQKGAIAESAIVHAAITLGIGVSRPTAPERYDLIFDLRPALVRVQCKWAVRRAASISIRCCSSRRGRDGILKRSYSASEIDAYAAFCAELGLCYFLPVDRFANQREITLRLAPALNSQRQLINWARDFEFEAKLTPYGAIAQLGERDAGSVEVAGSSPAGSTSEAV